MNFRNILRLVTKGDVVGHEFHGNQYTGGHGGAREEAVARSKDFIANNILRTSKTNDGSIGETNTLLDFEKERYTNNLAKIISDPEGFKNALASVAGNKTNPIGAVAIMSMLGNLGKPSVVWEEEFQKGDEYQRLFTGLSAPAGQGEEKIAGFAYGTNPTYGGGFYGTAFYTTELPTEAMEYAQEGDSGSDRMVVQMRLDWSNPEANNSSLGHAVNHIFGTDQDFQTVLQANGFDKETAKILTEGLSEVPADALCGYKLNSRLGYTMVYDRSILQISDTYAMWSGDAPSATGDEVFANQSVNEEAGVSAKTINRSLTKGESEGHPFRGNQYTTGEGGGGSEPHYVSFIRSHMDKFYGAGGKIESVESEKTTMAVANEIVAIERAIGDSGNERLKLGIEEMRASVTQQLELLANRGDNNDEQTVKPFFLVARDANGNLAACINGIKDEYGIRIGNLGSSQIMKGAATALQERVAQLADGKPVSSYALFDAVEYHISIGRDVDQPFDEETEQSMKNGETQIASYWNADTVKEIAALPSPEPVVVKSANSYWIDEINPFWQTPKGKAILSKLQVTKGESAGHVFHGNQYTQGASGSEGEDVSYRRDHSAPSNDGFCAPLHALDQIYPPDIYSDKALRYYGSGDFTDKADRESMKVINAVKGNPDAIVTIYRGVPKDVDTINAGDWVTLSKTYAEEHAEGNVQGGGKVISMKVPAKTVFTNADSINEFGYDPTEGVSKGESAGHPFRGNQYTTGESGGEPEVSPELRQHIRDFAENYVPSQFVETYTKNLSKILASPERYEKLRAELVAGGDTSFGGADITAIAMLSGIGGVPKVVSNSEFSKIDSPVLYQGISSGEETMNPGANRPAEGITAENMVANFAYSPIPHFGGGDYGIAYYTSEDPSVSFQYAQGEDNAMLRMKLPEDAVTISYDRAEQWFNDAYEPMKSLLEKAGFKNFDVENTRETSWFLGTMNTTVALCGVTALTRDTPYGQYTMVVNRSQVLVADTYSKIDTSYWAGTTKTGVYDDTPLLSPKDFGANGATGNSPKITNIKIDRSLTKSLIAKGDVAGHPFYGNQWIDGQGNFKPQGGRRTASPKANRVAQAIASMREDKKELSPKGKKFVDLSSIKVAKNVGDKLELGGAFNKGWQKVEMSDGSIAGVKTFKPSGYHALDATTQSQNEVLASVVGKVIDAPIRDTAFVGDKKWLEAEPQVVHPWIEGKTLWQTKDFEATPENIEDINKLRFFDQLIDNEDRFVPMEATSSLNDIKNSILNPTNIMVTDKGDIVGIDHAFAFNDNGFHFNQAIAPDFNLLGSPTMEDLDQIHASLMSLRSTFEFMGRIDSFSNMMTRFQTGAVTYMNEHGL